MRRKWEEWSSPGKGTENTNILGKEGFDSISELVEDDSSQWAKESMV